MIQKLYAQVLTFRASWESMSRGERNLAILNGIVDLFVCIFFLAEIQVGLTSDLYTFAFWVPFLAVILFFRWKQMRSRWKV